MYRYTIKRVADGKTFQITTSQEYEIGDTSNFSISSSLSESEEEMRWEGEGGGESVSSGTSMSESETFPGEVVGKEKLDGD